MQGISRFADLVILNVLILLTSLPLFTVGASVSAAYTLTFRMLRSKDEPVVKSYFRAFRENFRQGTALWLILLVAAVPALIYFDRFFTMEGIFHYLFVPFLTVFVLAVCAGSFAFPLTSQFQNSLAGTLRNALLLTLANLPRALAAAAINLLPLGLYLFQYELFLKVSFLWFALYFSAAAYMNVAILWKVFKPFYPEET
jgi:uncharacterized membrane protein YesL